MTAPVADWSLERSDDARRRRIFSRYLDPTAPPRGWNPVGVGGQREGVNDRSRTITGERMARKPSNFEWIGFSSEQIDVIDRLDFYGNNAWARTSQLDVMMPALLIECERSALSLVDVKRALAAIGYDIHALHQLERWESKRTTGVFGR